MEFRTPRDLDGEMSPHIHVSCNVGTAWFSDWLAVDGVSSHERLPHYRRIRENVSRYAVERRKSRSVLATGTIQLNISASLPRARYSRDNGMGDVVKRAATALSQRPIQLHLSLLPALARSPRGRQWNDALRKFCNGPFSFVLSRINASVPSCERKLFCCLK